MEAGRDLGRLLLTLRLLLGAMAAGVVLFGLIVVFVLRPQPRPAEVLLVCLATLGIAELVAWTVVGRIARRRVARQVAAAPADEADALLHRAFFNLCLVRAALCEAFCFFALVVHLLTATGWALVAAFAGLLLLAGAVPTRQSYRQFADESRGRRPV